MSTYQAPLKDMQFVMTELAGLDRVNRLPGYEDATGDTVFAILEEAAKFATSVLDPLNWSGDREGARREEDGTVRTAAGFGDAYRQFIEAGWNGLSKNPEFGGQGLPQLVATAVEEMWQSSNISFALCPLLTQGAIDALELCGTDAQKATYLPKMVSGEWTGTMNLTEPQAGSDLALVRTRAVPEADGTFRIFGQKIFITYGDHDLTDNVVHLVLARTPTAPPGVKGISLFVVPKFLVNADGSLGARNDVRCVSLESKLGIHASPTCVMAFGDKGGAVGTLVGEENRGLEYMFIMMNQARFSVGMQGVALGERSYQRALAYAKERVQGRVVGSPDPKSAPIVGHPDIRRMLMEMRSQTEAARALAYVTAAAIDGARANPDAEARRQHQAFVDLMIPIVKGWSTEMAQRATYNGIQVHGGMGFIEDTGAAQHYRDARIITIYEGTTGIQANDLIGRKTARDGGRAAMAAIGEMEKTAAELGARDDHDFRAIRAQLATAVAALREAVQWVVASFAADGPAVHAGAVPYLELWGITAGGWQMARAALVAGDRLAAGEGDASFYRAKIGTARFFADHVMSRAPGLKHAVVAGAPGVLALAEEQL
jgi:acyl-CoA dehydrogenase